jgi:uncharacterized protein (TIGR03083 family)
MNLEQHFLRETGAFAEWVRGLDPAAQVPTCPEWSVRVLVRHIGQAPRWAAGIVRTRKAAGIPDPREADPGSQDSWASWLIAGAVELVDAVNEDPDAVVWTLVGPRPAVFWLRRMVCDLAVHRADAAFTAGVPYDIDPGLAEEVISEGLGLFADVRALPGDGETLLLRPNEMAPWLVTRTPDGVVVGRAGDSADVVIAGSVRDLLLVFTRRVSADRVSVSGDRGLLDHWLTNTPF